MIPLLSLTSLVWATNFDTFAAFQPKTKPEKLVPSWNQKIAGFSSVKHDDISGWVVRLEKEAECSKGEHKGNG